jgi:hypothetical protein
MRTLSEEKILDVAIGFATGRKSFLNVLKTYIYNWQESGLVQNKKIRLNLFVAYDLTYHETVAADYTKIPPAFLNLVDDVVFIGPVFAERETDFLIQAGVLSRAEAELVFGRGYAAMRNAILYKALKQKMHSLIFLDDDEYPVAVTRSKGDAVWGGQHVLSTHLRNIESADMTHGHHCGYISPIPHLQFNDILAEDDFSVFIEAISNDIVKWENVKKTMENGGVTFADPQVLVTDDYYEVPEIDGAKFISGANLCINLRDPQRIFPFFNPPGARGEDTFLSTCLGKRRILKVPCYTFHDGFGTYNHLLHGVLPIHMKEISPHDSKNITRFYKACLGWVRYKPLLLYITHPESYSERIQQVQNDLQATLPKLSAYFDKADFMHILRELKKYHHSVEQHYQLFLQTQSVWAKVMDFFDERK